MELDRHLSLRAGNSKAVEVNGSVRTRPETVKVQLLRERIEIYKGRPMFYSQGNMGVDLVRGPILRPTVET